MVAGRARDRGADVGRLADAVAEDAKNNEKVQQANVRAIAGNLTS